MSDRSSLINRQVTAVELQHDEIARGDVNGMDLAFPVAVNALVGDDSFIESVAEWHPFFVALAVDDLAVIEIGVVPRSDQKANEAIEFTLINPDVVPHNWVLVQPETLASVGELANQLIADPEAFARQYIPRSDDFLFYTDIVSPDERQTISFNAPSTPGRYPYLCTFPGHWMVMNGIPAERPSKSLGK